MGGGSVAGEGNAIVLAPDESVLYVTSSNGILHRLDPGNGEDLGRYQPPSMSGHTIMCKSGVSIHDDEGNSYLIYAVIYQPTEWGAAAGTRKTRYGAVSRRNHMPIFSFVFSLLFLT